jgi:hypothetical protein
MQLHSRPQILLLIKGVNGGAATMIGRRQKQHEQAITQLQDMMAMKQGQRHLWRSCQRRI